MSGNRNKVQRLSSTKSGTVSGRRVGFGDFRFVKLDLLADEKQDLRRRLAEGFTEQVSIDYFVSEGYSVKFSLGDGGATVVCSISQANIDHQNAALILTGRGRDAITALAVCTYKHFILCNNGMWKEAEDRRVGSGIDIE